MRIPAELVPPIPPVANVGKESDDVRKVEPVASVTNLRSAVSAPPQEQAQPLGEQRSQPPTNATAQPENPPLAVERRQKERRSAKQPILLDTRSKKGRRQMAGDSKINIKV